MHSHSVSATEFSRKVATFLDQVRYTREPLAITKGNRVVAELVPTKPMGLSIEELIQVIAQAPKLNPSSLMADDLKKLRESTKNKLDNPWD